jgi:hypothetical protein
VAGLVGVGVRLRLEYGQERGVKRVAWRNRVIISSAAVWRKPGQNKMAFCH